jgi:dihydrofolate reductase
MRKLIVSNIVSLDGYYEGPSKNVMDLFGYRLDAYPADESFDAYNAERLRAADTLLLGRASYEGFKSYWPPVAEDPDTDTSHDYVYTEWDGVKHFVEEFLETLVPEATRDPQELGRQKG